MPASLVYNSAKVKFATATFNWPTNTFKILLVNGYTPSTSGHSSRADVTSEVTGTGYTAGGATLAGCTVTQDNTNNRAVLGATNPAWASSSITATGAVIYQSNGGGASGDPLVCYLDFGGTITSTSNTFSVVFGSAGVMTDS